MNNDELRCFVTLAECRSFNKTAQQLYITQPAVTQRISNLEKTCGFALFTRSTRHVALTEKGREFLPQVQKYLAELDCLKAEIAALRDEPVRRVRFGYITDGHAAIMMNLIHRLSVNGSSIQLVPIRLKPLDMFEAVARGEVDIALHCVLSAKSFGRALTIHPIGKPGFQAKLLRSHRLAREKELSIRDMEGESVLLFKRSHDPEVYDFIRAQFDQSGVQPRFVSVNGILEIEMHLLSQRVISLASACPGETDGMRLIPVHELAKTLELCAITQADAHDPDIDLMIDMLREA